MYVSLFFVVTRPRGCWGSLTIVTDGANVLSVRSRTTRSSKGKVSPMLSLLYLGIQSDSFSVLLSSSSPSHVLPTHPHITSSFPTQMPTPSNSRNNSASLASMRLTQLAMAIAFFAPSQTSCTVPSPATSNFERTFVTGYSHIASDTHLSLTTSVVWMSTFPSCVNRVRSSVPPCSILSLPTPCSATYGGHLELSAFAHMKKCNVKVIQPGLVYLIEWAAGWDPVVAKDNPTSSSSSLATTLVEREPIVNDRSRRAARRESKRAERDKVRSDKATTDDEDVVHKDNVTPTVYVASVSPSDIVPHT